MVPSGDGSAQPPGCRRPDAVHVGVLREAYPVNHFLEVAIIVLFVVTMAQRQARAGIEACLIALLAFALPLIETSVLIWVAIVACTLLRMPGIRPRTAIVATLLMVVYAGARSYLEIGTPQIGGHDSGYGGSYFSGDELRARFADNPLPFYAYNVAAGILGKAINHAEVLETATQMNADLAMLLQRLFDTYES